MYSTSTCHNCVSIQQLCNLISEKRHSKTNYIHRPSAANHANGLRTKDHLYY
jgi:hypothetical protein